MVRRLDMLMDESHAVEADAGRAERSIEAWLNLLVRLLRLPESKRKAIRDELQSHLQERVRDLVLSGAREPDAIREAIGELGETAELARNLSQAERWPRRRLIMNLSLLGIGAVVVAAGALTLGPGPSPAPFMGSIYEDVADTSAPPTALEDVVVSVAPDVRLEDVIEMIGDSADRGVRVWWDELSHLGIEAETPTGLQFSEIAMLDLMEALAESLSTEDPVEWRFGEHLMELAPREVFDHRERVLVAYDIDHILEELEADYYMEHGDAAVEIIELLQAMVSPIDWEDNGGVLAQHKIVGGRMFIKAPKRMHRQVNWILHELANGAMPETAQRIGGGGGIGGAGGSGGGGGGMGGAGGSGGGGGGMGGAGGSGAGGIGGGMR